MARKRLKIELKRRRAGKTDYRKRALLLKSGMPRLVVRKSNKYIIAQIVESKEAQDYVVCHATSKEIERAGWKGSFKNLGAAYLTGLLIAKKAIERKIKSAIPDFGLHKSTKGSRLYATLKGAADYGLKINFDIEMVPSEERIVGKDAEMFKKIKEKIETKIIQNGN